MARSKGGMIGAKTAIPGMNKYATSEEVAARDTAAHQMPQTAFKQISPEDGSTNVSQLDKSASHKGGDFKFGNPSPGGR